MPGDRNLLSLDASPCDPDACPPLRSISAPATRAVRPARRSDHSSWAVRPAWVAAPPRQVFTRKPLGYSVLWLNRVTQWFSGEPLQTLRTRCSLRQSPLMTWLPRSPGLTLVLRLNQETVHDFVPLFLPPCDPHLTPLATRSLKPSLLVFSTPRGLTGDDLSRLFFTCTNTNQAATCTCNN
jgi:hypothetical protein